ncbi:chaperonin 10-like protein [Cristinia sonorae]|uniref:Chaperonin 10-like protein n=1 Tax=Cristinia sonorae TaxID=1940300 RepID=A0A8K0UQ87_9AGAR|nr:chaperonin 10-like protein [Cristinia sonorae]
MRALVTAPGNTATVQDIPVPEPGANEIRIKVHSIALNPVDALYTFNPPAPPGRVVGSDVAGTVDKVGPGVTLWRAGDRVASFLQGATSGNERPGGFAEYAVVEADLAIAIPKEVSFDQAATVPLCSLTAAQALFIRLKIKPPFPSPFTYVPKSAESPTILIYSATTSLGLFVLELSKLLRTSAGNPYRIFATASPKNHDKLLQLGVEKVSDYREPEWPRGGTIACIRKSTWSKDNVREDVIGIYSSVWVGLGKDIIYNNELMPADPSWRKFTVEIYKWLSSATDRLPISPNPVRLMPGGLDRIVADGFTLKSQSLYYPK